MKSHKGRADPGTRGSDDPQCARSSRSALFEADGDQFARAHFMGGFARTPVYLHPAGFDGLSGKGARFICADCPQPLIQAQGRRAFRKRVHCTDAVLPAFAASSASAMPSQKVSRLPRADTAAAVASLQRNGSSPQSRATIWRPI